MWDRILDRRPLARAVAALIGRPVEQARSAVGHLVKIEVEVDTLAQLDEALALTPDAILLDNMSVDELRQAAKLVAGRVITEASRRVTAQTAPAIAATGADLISIGWLTHSAPILEDARPTEHFRSASGRQKSSMPEPIAMWP